MSQYARWKINRVIFELEKIESRLFNTKFAILSETAREVINCGIDLCTMIEYYGWKPELRNSYYKFLNTAGMLEANYKRYENQVSESVV